MGIFSHDDIEPSPKTVEILVLGRAGKYRDANGNMKCAGPYNSIRTDATTAEAAIKNKHAVLRNSEAALKVMEQNTPDYYPYTEAMCIDLATQPEIVGLQYYKEPPKNPNLHSGYDRYADDVNATDWVGKERVERVGTASATPPQKSNPRY